MDNANWFYQQNEQQIGPVTIEELINLLIQKIVDKNTYVWSEGMENWQQLQNIPDLKMAALAAHVPLRPTSVTVLGILNIVFGSLNLLCTPIAIVGLMVPQPNSPFQMGPGMKIYTAFGAILGLVCASVLLASGIGLLKQKNWARQAAYIYGWFSVVWGIVAIIINIFMFNPSLSAVPEEALPAVVGGIVGSMCGGIIGLIYPVVLIIYLKKPHIVQVCNR